MPMTPTQIVETFNQVVRDVSACRLTMAAGNAILAQIRATEPAAAAYTLGPLLGTPTCAGGGLVVAGTTQSVGTPPVLVTASPDAAVTDASMDWLTWALSPMTVGGVSVPRAFVYGGLALAGFFVVREVMKS